MPPYTKPSDEQQSCEVQATMLQRASDFVALLMSYSNLQLCIAIKVAMPMAYAKTVCDFPIT